MNEHAGVFLELSNTCLDFDDVPKRLNCRFVMIKKERDELMISIKFDFTRTCFTCMHSQFDLNNRAWRYMGNPYSPIEVHPFTTRLVAKLLLYCNMPFLVNFHLLNHPQDVKQNTTTIGIRRRHGVRNYFFLRQNRDISFDEMVIWQSLCYYCTSPIK